MTTKPNYYLILDLMPGASHNEILHAYNRAKSTYTSGSLAAYSILEGEESSSILEEIEQAFGVLGNPSKRREYDLEMNFKTWVDEDDAKSAHSKVTPLASIRSPKSTVNGAPSHEDMGQIEKEIDEEVSVTRKTVVPLNDQVSKQAAPSSSSPSERLIGVQFEPNPEFEKKIAECAEVDGAFLKAVRIYRCYTVENLAHRCKLSSSHVMAVENEDASALHQPVYLRGHVYLIAQALDLPGADKLAKRFVDRMLSEGKIPKKIF
jgi:hypothetical protein